MNSTQTLILTRSDVASLIDAEECLSAVENSFALLAEGKAYPPGILGRHVSGGGFHIKAGIWEHDVLYFIAKINANFPFNRSRTGLPTIQGAIVVSNAEDGRLLAITDSTEITVLRTGAATALAAKHLAKKNAKTLTICGCGNQGRISLKMLMNVLPIEKVYAYDIDHAVTDHFVKQMSIEYPVTILKADDLGMAVRQSDVCVTCTTSTRAFLKNEWVQPGAFIAAVGADHEEKQEVEPLLVARSRLVVDALEQCATIGELHHTLNAGLIKKEEVHAELGEIIVGKKSGRTSDDEIFIFDSTGIALQDAATVSLVYEKALKYEKGLLVDLMK
ncbi:ornithine cyclodeaminase family protein [bacterium]|nr:ornithine cyclodeaminase family protein [bacterium]